MTLRIRVRGRTESGRHGRLWGEQGHSERTYILIKTLGWVPGATILQRVVEGIKTRVEH